MNTCASALANYFILKAKDTGGIDHLKLMKLVYIAYGFGLATLNRSFLNPKYDRVEAWLRGPVIPSIYHTFKRYGKKSIFEVEGFLKEEDDEYIIPKLEDDIMAQKVCDMVWSVYHEYSGNDLVAILHKKGTPWRDVYVKDMNIEIPEAKTKKYYTLLYKLMLEDARIAEQRKN